ncbi:hypothetical protein MRX96_011271 [Rhipicephalus microplus]
MKWSSAKQRGSRALRQLVPQHLVWRGLSLAEPERGVSIPPAAETQGKHRHHRESHLPRRFSGRAKARRLRPTSSGNSRQPSPSPRVSSGAELPWQSESETSPAHQQRKLKATIAIAASLVGRGASMAERERDVSGPPAAETQGNHRHRRESRRARSFHGRARARRLRSNSCGNSRQPSPSPRVSSVTELPWQSESETSPVHQLRKLKATITIAVSLVCHGASMAERDVSGPTSSETQGNHHRRRESRLSRSFHGRARRIWSTSCGNSRQPSPSPRVSSAEAILRQSESETSPAHHLRKLKATIAIAASLVRLSRSFHGRARARRLRSNSFGNSRQPSPSL